MRILTLLMCPLLNHRLRRKYKYNHRFDRQDRSLFNEFTTIVMHIITLKSSLSQEQLCAYVYKILFKFLAIIFTVFVNRFFFVFFSLFYRWNCMHTRCDAKSKITLLLLCASNHLSGQGISNTFHRRRFLNVLLSWFPHFWTLWTQSFVRNTSTEIG